ncbi:MULTISPECIES: hypothetical protein [Streptomycetaceae]|uniref:hypothetical protein n=1 Tax=Streptomycetaceae TaxID=2062 RepID=UPI00093ADCD9|nr:hypothetical protein [Streptomyces sp. CB02056]OKH97540.1 hypothetical protein AMK13_38195 [Streptomyces sp. CB02056]
MHADLDIGGRPISNIRLRCGDPRENWRPERGHLPGWGVLIEVPAVPEGSWTTSSPADWTPRQ